MGPHHVFHLGCSPLRGPALVCGHVRISVILRQYVDKTPYFYVRISVILRQYVYKTPNFIR